MNALKDNVDIRVFTINYLNKAEKIFFCPITTYPWNEIVSGTIINTHNHGKINKAAVNQNTFRGFHRINKECSGAKNVFVEYFISQRNIFVKELKTVGNIENLNDLSDLACREIRNKLTNIIPKQLQSYNKVRKPVDLYIEHLVAMAVELEEVRMRLVPLLFLPLDNQILAFQGLFTDQELKQNNLTRTSTFKDITSKNIYIDLQNSLSLKGMTIQNIRHNSFHRIYFDLLWNNRFNYPGGNLFEISPAQKNRRNKCLVA